MQEVKEATYAHAQNLSRGLHVLRALNDAPGGDATPREISERTRLNRSTVKRILETLVADGYVRPCGASGSYGLSPQVRALSRGLSSDAAVVESASQVLREIARSTRWSLRIATARDDRMVIRDTSHADSNVAAEFTVGLRHSLPMLLTAAGRAHLAFCEASERSRVLQLMRNSQDEQAPLAKNARLVELITQRVLDDGYSTNDGDWGGGALGAVALPIRDRGGKTLACMSMLYPRKGCSRPTIEREFVPTLRRGVDRVEAMLAA